MNPSVLHVATHCGFGGAGRAAHRILEAQLSVGTRSNLICLKSDRQSPAIEVFEPKSASEQLRLVQAMLQAARKFSSPANPYAELGRETNSGVVDAINRSSCDIVHLHWIDGALSVRDIALIRKPIVWTLHDMWAFCGDTHYAEDSEWMSGFKSLGESHPERIAWQLKAKFWQEAYQIVTPSQWLKQCVNASALMSSWATEVIPCPISCDTWRPMDKALVREAYRLPNDKKLMLFGAVSGMQGHRKGFDLLQKALKHMPKSKRDIALVVFGDAAPHADLELDIPVYFLGSVQDDEELCTIYSAADVFIAPSRLEALGQTALEAQACGTPVVAFDNSGLRDTVAHKQTGYLARAFDPIDLAQGIDWTLDQMQRQEIPFRLRCQTRIKSKFSYSVVGKQYAELYKKICYEKGINA